MEITIDISEEELEDIRSFMQKPYQTSTQRAVWNLLKNWFEGDVVESPTKTFDDCY